MLLWLLAIVTAIQLCYWWILYRRTLSLKNPGSRTDSPVSVIICAHNESENLKSNLPYILDQNHPEFEVIVVDDCSTDESRIVLQHFLAAHSKLKVIHLSESSGVLRGKKRALTHGIRAAKYPHLLLTDADCLPASPEWISLMQGGLNDKRICIGISPFLKTAGFLNKYIRFDGIFAAIQYLSYAIAGIPYMGVGRNLMYHRDVFFEQDGFMAHANILTGDDDLLFAGMSSREKVGIQSQTKSFVFTHAKKSWNAFFNQKRRQNKASLHYKLHHKHLLGLSSLTHMAFYYIIITAFLTNSSMLFVVFCYAMRLLTILLFYSRVLPKFQSLDLLKWIPVLDLSYVIVNSFLAPALIIGKHRKWD